MSQIRHDVSLIVEAKEWKARVWRQKQTVLKSQTMSDKFEHNLLCSHEPSRLLKPFKDEMLF